MIGADISWAGRRGGRWRLALMGGWAALLCVAAAAGGQTAPATMPGGDVPATMPSADEFLERVDKESTKADLFDGSLRALAIDPATQLGLMGKSLSGVLVLDDNLVARHFEFLRPDQVSLRRLLAKWGRPADWLSRYLSVPFYVEPAGPGGEAGGRRAFTVVASSKLAGAPLAVRFHYRNMFKVLTGLPAEMRDSPTMWTYGVSSLVAMDLSGPSSLAACPDLEIETATAFLLVQVDGELCKDLADAGFNRAAYEQKLLRAIGRVGSSNPGAALKALLASPDEVLVEARVEVAQRQQEVKEKPAAAPDLPPMHPSMAVLWQILPDDERGLERLAAHLEATVGDRTIRFVLLNACQDKLSRVRGQKMLGTVADSTMLLRLMLDGAPNLQGLGPKFEAARQDVWRGFREDLDLRGQKGEASREEGVAFSPAMLEWAFRFLYDTSVTLRKEEKEVKDGLKKANPSWDQEKLEGALFQQVTPAMVMDWWRKDALLKRLFDTVGEPRVEMHDSEVSRTGKVIECIWQLRRKGRPGDQEEVRVRLFDPYSSGGGMPAPGVHDGARVVVRKELGKDPEEVALKEVRKGYFIRTMSQIDTKGPGGATEDWARVKAISGKETRGPWQLESGAREPLAVGRAQQVWARVGEEGEWEWRAPQSLAQRIDWMLGVSPETATPGGQGAGFPAAGLTKSGPLDKGCPLVELTLSFREVQAMKEGGAGVWGYFADGRLVQAQVYKAPEGVDGAALVELPGGGNKALEQVAAAETGGDQVSAFDYGNPQTFKDRVVKRSFATADYCIELTYQLPDGPSGSIRVAEGQALVVAEADGVRLKKVYQLKIGAGLVCGFGEDGRPRVATVTGMVGKEMSLGVHRLKLQECPLVRMNGILIAVETNPSKLFAGLDHAAVIRLAPPLTGVIEANKERDGEGQPTIDLSGVGATAAEKIDTSSRVLSYGTFLPPASFHSSQIAKVVPDDARRYLQIKTAETELMCGHMQEVYATPNGWEELRAVAAGQLKAGMKVAWLSGEASGRASVRLAAVVSVREVMAAEDLHLLQFIVPDSAAVRAGLRPNAFANGLLVALRVAPPDAQGQDTGMEGPGRTNPAMAAEPGAGHPQPGMSSVPKILPPEVPVKFEKEDLAAFSTNLSSLHEAFDGHGKLGQWDKLSSFLRHYFQNQPGAGQVYDEEALRSYLEDYLQARNYLVETGDRRVSPILVNAYAFLGTILYGGGAQAAGDALTRDFLCLTLRTLDKPGGSDLYSNDKMEVRAGLLACRELVGLVRDRGDGFAAVAGAAFPRRSLEQPLDDQFIKIDKLHPDIISGEKVNLYNLCRQLDHWSRRTGLDLGECLLAPGYEAAHMFEGDLLDTDLGIHQKK